MGQLRSDGCPVCGTPNSGRWTCTECTELVNVHRDLIRNLQQWHSHYEAQEVSDVLVAGGKEYCLWDVDRFYEQRTLLPSQQATAIRLCLYENALEREAAVRMGVSPTNPVLIYATVGLTKLLGLAYRHELPGYRLPVALVAVRG